MKTMILDTESNGTKPAQLCQLSYIVSENGSLQTKNFFFSVMTMNQYAQKKHGFSKMKLYQLSHGKEFHDYFPEIENDFKDIDLICGHNIDSDMRILKNEFRCCQSMLKNYKTFDTMIHFGQFMHLKGRTGQPKPPRLDELCSFFRLSDEEIQATCSALFHFPDLRQHDARYDTTATYLCILAGQKNGEIKGVI